MNRYVAAGIAADIAQGKRVIVLTLTTDLSREALDELAERAPEGSRIERANGAERITCPSGGRVILRSYRQGSRGHGADVIFLDYGVDERLGESDWRSLQASLSGSPHRELIRS